MQNNANIRNIKSAMVLKVYFLKLQICVYLRAKFQVSSIFLTRGERGGRVREVEEEELVKRPPGFWLNEEAGK